MEQDWGSKSGESGTQVMRKRGREWDLAGRRVEQERGSKREEQEMGSKAGEQAGGGGKV